MKKWLRKWLTNLMRDEGHYPEENKIAAGRPIGLTTKSHDAMSSQGLNCTLYKANGGTVVEFRNYDVRTDRNNCSLHVIPDSEDFGNSFSKIVTVELMRL